MIKPAKIKSAFSMLFSYKLVKRIVCASNSLIIKLSGIIILLLITYACVKDEITANFEDQTRLTIYDYIVQNKADYSSFLSILEKAEIDKTLSAYNPENNGYTLFLPDNSTIARFISESDSYSSLPELLEDTAYVRILARYHIVDMSIITDDFPFGALPEYTLSGDRLTVSFVIEPDTSYYKINNQAPVVFQDIELSNGYIHIISNMLSPVIFTSYEWLEKQTELSIFKAAIDATGLKETLDINTKDKTVENQGFTLFIEPDSVFHKRNIFTFEDLAEQISPGESDYLNADNLLNGFMRYHLLTDVRFLDDFVDIVTNYTTFSEIPMNINGGGLDIAINLGMQNFDTLVNGIDTTIIDYVSFNYDASNVLTQSGVVHFIDQVLQQQKPVRAIQTFQFYEEPLFNEFRLEPGTYIVEDSASLNAISYSGTDLFFTLTGDATSSAWGGDYVFLNGDFTVSYTIPKLVQGAYTVFLGADSFNPQNAVIEITIDGKKMGGLIDLSTGGSSAYPFTGIELGPINFVKYEGHKIEVKSLIPGKFNWDYIRFEPL